MTIFHDGETYTVKKEYGKLWFYNDTGWMETRDRVIAKLTKIYNGE